MRSISSRFRSENGADAAADDVDGDARSEVDAAFVFLFFDGTVEDVDGAASSVAGLRFGIAPDAGGATDEDGPDGGAVDDGIVGGVRMGLTIPLEFFQTKC